MKLVKNKYYDLTKPWHLGVLGWLVFFVWSYVYCSLYVTLVEPMPSHFVFAFIWTLREFGIWAAATPIIFKMLYAWSERGKLSVAKGLLLAASVLVIALSYRLLLEWLIAPDARLLSSFIYFLPGYISCDLTIILAWWIFLSPYGMSALWRTQPDHCPVQDVSGDGLTLTVNKGVIELELPVQQIVNVSAAGNYMEVHTLEQMYLARATLKQVKDVLTPQEFVRTHRSHLVNVRYVETVQQKPRGYQLLLKNGRSVPVSHTYKNPVSDALRHSQVQPSMESTLQHI